MKQQFTGEHVVPLRHIIIFPSQPVSTLTFQWRVLSGKSSNTNCIDFDLTRAWTHDLLHPRIERNLVRWPSNLLLQKKSYICNILNPYVNTFIDK